MTISTPYSVTPYGSAIFVQVVSDLTDPTIYWYLDGVFVGATRALERWFFLEPGEQADVFAIDSTSSSFDPLANAPTAYPARKTLWWVRSVDPDVVLYRVEQDEDGGGYETIAEVDVEDGRWDYSTLTPRLTDLATYTWKIVPVDAAGNEGTELTLGPELVVRKPDAPTFTASFNAGPDTVTLEAA